MGEIDMRWRGAVRRHLALGIAITATFTAGMGIGLVLDHHAVVQSVAAMTAAPIPDVRQLEQSLETVENSDFSEAKLGRWLGWAQCAVVAANVGVTLADVKALNMQCASDSENRPHNCNTPYGPRCWCEQPGYTR